MMIAEPADTVTITAIEAYAHHGVYDSEKTEGQPFLADVSYRLDTRAASRDDDVASTVSYADVAAAVHEELVGGPSRTSYDLLETVAENIARRVLALGQLTWVKVCVHKPEAPIAVPYCDVTLTIERTPLSVVPARPRRVLLALGANSGTDPATQLARAVVDLETRVGQGPGTALRSPLLRTAALLAPGQSPQPDYYNCAVMVESQLAAEEILKISQELEVAAGRVRSEQWGQRPLDIDIIAIEGLSSEEAHLQLPHPRACERPFVIVPAAHIAPDMRLGEQTVGDCLHALPGSAAGENNTAGKNNAAGENSAEGDNSAAGARGDARCGGAVLAEVPWP